METSSIRVLLVEDYEPWRRYYSTVLQKQQGLQVIGEASDGLGAIQKTVELQPDLILLDIGLPTLNGIAAARQIRQVFPASKILFVSENRSVDIAEEALNTGAGGYVLKSDAAGELLPAIKAVLAGKRFISVSLAVHALNGSPLPQTGASFSSDTVTTLIPAQNMGSAHQHEAGFYADDSAFLQCFASFMEGALKHGSPVILIATASHRKSLFQILKADGLDVDAAIAQGMYIPLDAADTLQTFMVNDLPDPVRFMSVARDLVKGAVKNAKGDRHVAACGECAPILLARGNAEAAIRLEHLWDEIAKSYDVDILCGYVSTALQEEENSHSLLRICAEHSAIHGREIVH